VKGHHERAALSEKKKKALEKKEVHFCLHYTREP